jgi:hypothetical protein
MGDNKNIQDGRDRSKVSGSDSYEFQYLEQKLGVTREQIEKAIEAVGSSREKIEEFLARQGA